MSRRRNVSILPINLEIERTCRGYRKLTRENRANSGVPILPLSIMEGLPNEEHSGVHQNENHEVPHGVNQPPQRPHHQNQGANLHPQARAIFPHQEEHTHDPYVGRPICDFAILNLEHTALAIVLSHFLGGYEMKTRLVNLVSSNSFHGFPSEDPNGHISRFHPRTKPKFG